MPFIKGYLLLLAVIAICLITGKILSFLAFRRSGNQKLPRFTKLFFELLAGWVAWVVVYSIVETAFITINVVFVFVALLILYERNKFSEKLIGEIQADQKEGFSYGQILALAVASLFFYSWAYVFIMPDAAWIDNLIYARQSYFLSHTGQENEFYLYNLLDSRYHGTTPYYFFMLWSTSILNALIGGTSVINFSLLFPALSLFVVYIGILGIWECFRKVNYLVISLSVLLPFMGGLILEIYYQHRLTMPMSVYSWSMPISIIKFFPLYLFFLAFVLLLLYDRFVTAFLVLTCLSVVTIIAVPAVVLGTAIFFLLAYLFRLFDRKVLLRMSLYCVAIIALVILFYMIFGNKTFQRSDVVANKSAVEGLLADLFSLENLKTRFNILAHVYLFISIPYFPFFIAVIVLMKKLPKGALKKKLASILLAGFCIFTGSVLGWAMIFNELASNRIFEASAPLMNLTFIMIAIVYFSMLARKGAPLWRQPAAIVMGLIVAAVIFISQARQKRGNLGKEYDVYSGHSAGYIEAIQSAFKSGEVDEIGGGIRGEKEFFEIEFSYVTYNSVKGDYLFQLNNDWNVVSLSDYTENTIRPDSLPGAELYNKRRLKYLSLGIFYQFVAGQKNEGTFRSVHQSQIDFIDRFKLSYLIVSPTAKLSTLLQERIKRELVDSITGDRFIILEPARDFRIPVNAW